MPLLPSKTTHYADWYNELIKKADLAEHANVRGCMVIKPHGYALWEKMQAILDKRFKALGHVNAYFPLFIPASCFSKEAQHMEFAKECAVVSHYRLIKDGEGKIVPDPTAKLQEPLIVRPTSETTIWSSYRKWIQSYRDLPLLINQWANVVRWEMRTRPFLRTTEFLWQEGHTAHATAEEARAKALQMLGLYEDFMHNTLAIPVIKGTKTAHERFAGADTTYTFEALMQDGKALQAGTSHFLGQNFAKTFDVKFATQTGGLEHVWGTSWGVTTRLIGAMIMTHSDEKGLVLPPKIAPHQLAIIPIGKGEAYEAIYAYAQEVHKQLSAHGIPAKLDARTTHSLGWKLTQHELQGMPLTMVIGAKEMAAGQVTLTRRDTAEKAMISTAQLIPTVQQWLEAMQAELFQKAQTFVTKHTTPVDSYADFKRVLKEKKGYVLAHWDGATATECKIKEETQATVRCIPLDAPTEAGKCIYTGKPSTRRALFAQAY